MFTLSFLHPLDDDHFIQGGPRLKGSLRRYQNEPKHRAQPNIRYCGSRQACRAVCEFLCTWRLGISTSKPFVNLQDITSANSSALLAFKDTFFSPTPGSYIHQYAPCSAIHPGQTSCLSVPADRFVAVFKWMLPIYGALHFVPAVLFKRKLFVKDPLKMLLKAAWGTGRSSAFLGVFVIIYQCMSSTRFFSFFFSCSSST